MDFTVRRLLDTFFVGFGIATAVHFLFLPITSRDLVTLVLNEHLHFLKGAIDAQSLFIKSMPTRDWGAPRTEGSLGESQSENSNPDLRLTPWPEAEKWRVVTAAASETQVKIRSEMRYVKREFAWSKLSAADFVSISKLLLSVLLPILGMESVIQVTDRVEKHGGWASMKNPRDGPESLSDRQSTEETEKDRWTWLFGELSGPIQQLFHAMIEGLDYAFFKLEITKKPAFSTKAYLEAKVADSPDGKGFASYVESSIETFLREREGPLKEWCQLNGMNDLGEQHAHDSIPMRHQVQLYMVLDVRLLVLS